MGVRNGGGRHINLIFFFIFAFYYMWGLISALPSFAVDNLVPLPSGTLVTATSYQSNYPPQNAIDNNTSTYWQGKNMNDSLTLSLPTAVNFKGIRIWVHSNVSTVLTYNIYVYKNASWIKVGTFNTPLSAQLLTYDIVFSLDSYQKLRIDVSSNTSYNYPNIYEVYLLMSSPPATPSGLQAQAISPTKVQLTWQPNTEPDLAGYIIYRDYVEVARVTKDTTSYLDSGLIPGTSYTYGIKAYNTAGVQSGMSNAAVVTTPLLPSPANLRVEVSLTGAVVAWDAVPEAESYNVYLNGLALSSTNYTWYEITGLSPGTSYTVEVAAVSGGKEGNLATVSFTTLSFLQAPQGLTAIATAYNQVQLNWQPNTDSGLAGYIIYRDYVEIAKVGPNETTYVDNTVQPNTTYIYGVKAYDVNGNISDISNAATVTTPVAINAPKGLTATVISYNQVQLTWQPNTDPNLAGYIIYRDYIEIARVGATENTYIDNTVSPNTRYIYGIKAYSTDGFISDISNAATVTTPASPHPVITVRVDGRTIKISWTSSGSGFNYKVLINDTEVANVTKTSYDYSASGPGYYTVQIVAVSPSGEEFPSTKVGVTVSSIVSSYNMVTDVLQNTGAILLPTGGLLALYFGLKATPFLIEIVKTFIARRL